MAHIKQKQLTFLPTFEMGTQAKTNPQLLRVLLHPACTQLDFGYAAPKLYDRGGWIRIAPHTYLRVQGSPLKYKMLEAINIRVAPDLVEFESQQDWQVFSLLFEPIPLRDCSIDMIEEENPTPNDFNFYNIRLTNLKTVTVL
jgi:hypothetical protein